MHAKRLTHVWESFDEERKSHCPRHAIFVHHEIARAIWGIPKGFRGPALRNEGRKRRCPRERFLYKLAYRPIEMKFGKF